MGAGVLLALLVSSNRFDCSSILIPKDLVEEISEGLRRFQPDV